MDKRIRNCFKEALSVAKPKPFLNCPDWASEYLYIPSGEARYPGRFNTSLMPFQYEMLQVASEKNIGRITYMLGSQLSKTQSLTAISLYYTHWIPSSVGIYFSNDKHLKAFSKDRLQASIDCSPDIKKLVRNNTTKNSGNTQLHKRATNGAIIRLLNASVGDSFRGPSMRIVALDEASDLPYDVEGEGDPIQQALSRTTVWGDLAKLIVSSTPTIKDACITEASFLQSDQRYYYVPCPHPDCKQMQVLKMSTPDENGDPYYWFKIPDGKPEEAYFECQYCHKKIEDKKHKVEMLAKGEWRKHNPDVKNHAGFHLSTFYSPLFPWEKLAAEWMDAVSKGASAKKAFINTRLAETWSDYDSLKLNLNALSLRREPYSAFIPKEVAYLTGFADFQKDRIEYTLLGHGLNDQAWVIRHYVIYGEPITSYSPCLKILDSLILKEYRHESGKNLKVLCTFCDSGEGKKTQIVYEYCKERLKKCVFASKGSSGFIRGGLQASQEQMKKGNPLVNVDTNQFKNLVIQDRLGLKDKDKPGYIHFPLARITVLQSEEGTVDYVNPDGTSYDSNYFEQLLSEYKKSGRWVKKVEGRPNEALDCLVGAMAAFWYAKRQKWARVNVQAQLDRLNGKPGEEGREEGQIPDIDQSQPFVSPEKTEVITQAPVIKKPEYKSINDLIGSYNDYGF